MDHPSLLCPTCDNCIRHQHLTVGTQAHCPHCHTRLYSESHLDLNGLLALALTGLLLYFPAHLLPALELNLMGNIRETSVAHTPFILFSEHFYLVGFAVLLCGVIAPLLLLISIIAQIIMLRFANKPWLLRQLLLHHPTLNQLSMIEILLISFLVSIFKLSDFANLSYSWGSFCYILLFIFIFYVQYEYNSEIMWSKFDKKFA